MSERLRLVIHWRLVWLPGVFSVDVGTVDGRAAVVVSTRRASYFLKVWRS